MASSHREGPTAARAALRCIIAYCVEFGKTWSEPSPPPAGAPPPRGEARVGGVHSAPAWLPLWGSCHGFAVTEREKAPLLAEGRSFWRLPSQCSDRGLIT